MKAKPVVLVVDDNAMIQTLSVDFLESLGLAAETASSAAEARNMLAALGGKFDGVILDIGLPDTRGDVLLGELRDLYPDLPIIIATGTHHGDIRQAISGRGAVVYLGKPYRIDNMRSALIEAGIIGSERAEP